MSGTGLSNFLNSTLVSLTDRPMIRRQGQLILNIVPLTILIKNVVAFKTLTSRKDPSKPTITYHNSSCVYDPAPLHG